MTLDTVEHFGESQIREAGTLRNRIVASRAIQIEMLLRSEVGDVRELQVDVHARDDMVGNHPSLFGEAGVLDFFRIVTVAAIRCVRVRC